MFFEYELINDDDIYDKLENGDKNIILKNKNNSNINLDPYIIDEFYFSSPEKYLQKKYIILYLLFCIIFCIYMII